MPKLTPDVVGAIPAAPTRLATHDAHELAEYALERARTFGGIGSEEGDRIPSISYSELDAFRQCPLKWYLQWHIGVVPPFARPALDFGSKWHLVLNAHHRQLTGDPAIELGDVRPAVLDVIGRFKESDAETLLWMYDGYAERWGVEPGFKTIAVELRMETTLGEGDEAFRLKGFIDLYRQHLETERDEIIDHKSATGDVSSVGFEREMKLDDQFSVYDLLAAKTGLDAFRATYDATRKDKLKRKMTALECNARFPLIRTPAERETLEAELIRTVRSMRQSGQEPERFLYSAPDPKVCKWKCDVKEAHIVSRETGRDPVLVAIEDFGFGLKPDRGVPAAHVGEPGPNAAEEAGF